MVRALGKLSDSPNEVADELCNFGYRDGRSMIVYENVSDLREKLKFYSRHKDRMITIQEGARTASIH